MFSIETFCHISFSCMKVYKAAAHSYKPHYQWFWHSYYNVNNVLVAEHIIVRGSEWGICSWDVCMYVYVCVGYAWNSNLCSCSGTRAPLICVLHKDIDGGQSWGKWGTTFLGNGGWRGHSPTLNINWVCMCMMPCTVSCASGSMCIAHASGACRAGVRNCALLV